MLWRLSNFLNRRSPCGGFTSQTATLFFDLDPDPDPEVVQSYKYKKYPSEPPENIDLMVFKAETTGVVTEIFGKHPKGRNLEGGPVNAVGASRSGPGNFLEKQDTEIWEEAPFY